MRHFKNPYADFGGGGDPRAPYPDDALKEDLERLAAGCSPTLCPMRTASRWGE